MLVTLAIALNKIDLRRNLTSRNLDKIRSRYLNLVFDTCISIDTVIPNCFDEKVPVRELGWRSRTVSQFQTLLQPLHHAPGGRILRGMQDATTQ